MHALLAWFLLGCSQSPTLGDAPDALNDLASAASAAYEHALSADWSAVGRDAERANEAWSTLREVAAKEGAPKLLLVAVDVAIESLTSLERKVPATAARIANTLSSLAGQVYGVFKGVLPAGALSLAPAEREVTLDGMDGDPVEVAKHLADLGAAWAAVRQDVVDLGGEKEAKEMDEWLGRAAAKVAAGDVDGIGADGKGAQIIDTIEGLLAVPWASTEERAPARRTR
jgi:hypothetical protein